MNNPGIILVGLALLACGNTTLAEIYETTRDGGSPSFTDMPENPQQASEVTLQRTNIADAPAQSDEGIPDESGEIDQAQFSHKTPEDEDPNWLEDDDSSMPREVLDAQAPNEVGDF